MTMTFPPSRDNRFVEAIALSIVVEASLVFMDAIINAKVKPTRDVDRSVMVAVEPFNRRSIDAVAMEEEYSVMILLEVNIFNLM